MKLGLGTVQFGLDYGISNDLGQTHIKEVQIILQLCKKHHIDVIDTAHAYGESETVIGKTLPKDFPFRVFSKLPALKKQNILEKDIQKTLQTFSLSLERLKKNSIEGLYLHRAEDLLSCGGKNLYKHLHHLKEQKKIKKIGISIYDLGLLEKILSDFEIDIIQAPINILDQRLLQYLSVLKQKNIEIHARSIFLQGLLLLPINKVNDYFSRIFPLLKKYQQLLKKENLSLLQGALNFIRQHKQIDYIIIGVNNSQQLLANLDAFHHCNAPNLDFSEFAIEEAKFIHPSFWNCT